MWRSRTFWRLFSTYGLLWVAAIGLLGVVVVRRVEGHYLRDTEEHLRGQAFLWRELAAGRPAADAPDLQRRAEALQQGLGTRVTLIAPDGTVLVDSERDPRRHAVENHGQRPELLRAEADGLGITRGRHSATVGQDMMYVALRTGDPVGAVGYARVALSLSRVEGEMATLRRLVWTAAATVALAGMALTFWLARRITHPLHELTRGAEEIARGAYGRRVLVAGRDEVGQLAHNFNAMSQHLAEQFTQLEADRQQLRTILSGMVEGVVALDADRRVLFANERAVDLLDLPGQAGAGRRLWELVRLRALHDVVERALLDPKPQFAELNWTGAEERSLTVHVARLPGTPPRGAVVVLYETTELRRLERLRQDFVANVSHELKTPLSVIKACSETLLDGAVDDAQNRGRFLQQIADQAERLHALILDLLSLARIESGEETLEIHPVDVAALAADCLERHRARAEARKQTLDLEVHPPGLTALADDEALHHILDNLVDNAVKYTPEGSHIRVRCRATGGEAVLEVADNGPGIPERDLPRIFERFYRVDKARSRELGGTGLGLAIVKHLAQALGGTAEAESQLGRGTVFTVRLPRPDGV